MACNSSSEGIFPNMPEETAKNNMRGISSNKSPTPKRARKPVNIFFLVGRLKNQVKGCIKSFFKILSISINNRIKRDSFILF
jgi:hypothetical protein